MILLFILLLLIQYSNCDELLLTNNVTYSGTIYFPNSFNFSYNFNLEVTKQHVDNSEFPNKIRIFNFCVVTSDSNWAPAFPILFYFDGYINYVECVPSDPNNTTCQTYFPNGKLTVALKFVSGPSYLNAYDLIQLFVLDGYLYNSNDGSFFNNEMKCLYYKNVDVQQICNSGTFDSIKLPRPNTGQCNKFRTTASINDDETTFAIDYVKMNNNGRWNITIEMINYSEYGYSYEFGPNIASDLCSGNDEEDVETCIFEKIENQNINAQFEMVFVYKEESKKRSVAKGLIVGEITYAFGNYYKSFNIPFTPNDPCWTKESFIPFTNDTLNATFCCVSFDDTPLELTSQISSVDLSKPQNLNILSNSLKSLNTVYSSVSPDKTLNLVCPSINGETSVPFTSGSTIELSTLPDSSEPFNTVHSETQFITTPSLTPSLTSTSSPVSSATPRHVLRQSSSILQATIFLVHSIFTLFVTQKLL